MGSTDTIPTTRDTRTDPRYGDLCRDEAGVVWQAYRATDDLVYVNPALRKNLYDVCADIEAEYDETSTAEAAAGGDPGAEDNGGCWLREDWAALPAVAA